MALTGLLAAALASGAEPAGADAPIEGVWSFTGGKIAVELQPNGTFLGTVVSPTKFAQCTHPVGEEMWTQLTVQKDGSYWGMHQWFFETEECVRNPALGPTAWRVLQRGNERFLRVCFSAPGSNSQPTIAPDGSSAGVTFRCVDSARISALPEVTAATFGQYVKLPKNKGCLNRKQLRIRIRDPKNDPIAKFSVTLRSGKAHRKAKIKQLADGAIATLNLGGLPKLTFTVRVKLTTVLGHHLFAKRKYRRCGSRRGKAPRPHRVRQRG